MEKIYLLVNDIHSPGGTERATFNLAGVLNDQGYDVEILSLYSNATAGNVEVPGVAVRNVNLPQTRHLLHRQLNLIKALRRLDIPRGAVVIGTNVGINTGMALIARPRGWKTVGCEHMIYEDTSWSNKMIRKFLYKWLNNVVVLTREDQKSYNRDGIKASVIPNMLPFYPTNTKISTMESKKLLAVGRLTPGKGFDTIIPLLAPLLHHYPEWALDIIGEGELRPVMESQIRTLSLDGQVHLRGASKVIEEHYGEASIFLLTSRSESFGMVLIEAKAFGLPVVAYDAPHGPRDIVREEEDGFLIPMGDTSKFLEKTEMLMSRPDLRRDFSTRARETVKIYLPERVAPLWIELIKNL